MTTADNGTTDGVPLDRQRSAHSDQPAGPWDKPTLRAHARRLRAAAITQDESGTLLSQAVTRRIAASDQFAAATTVLTYVAFGSEVDLRSLHDAYDGPAGAAGRKRFAVPLTHAPDSRLTFHLLAGADLRTSRSGFREPLAAAPQVPLHEVDLVLVPGLAFAVDGTRLGYGKGFYDRFLAELRTAFPAVPTVGVTIDALVFDALPQDPHDVAVTHLATESGLRPVGG